MIIAWNAPRRRHWSAVGRSKAGWSLFVHQKKSCWNCIEVEGGRITIARSRCCKSHPTTYEHNPFFLKPSIVFFKAFFFISPFTWPRPWPCTITILYRGTAIVCDYVQARYRFTRSVLIIIVHTIIRVFGSFAILDEGENFPINSRCKNSDKFARIIMQTKRR